MRVQHCTDPQIFYERVVPYLQQREAEHNMMLGTMGDLLRTQPADPVPYTYMAYVENEAGEVVAAAHFGGFRLFLSYPAAGSEAAFDMLLNDAASIHVTRMLAPTDFSASVADVWLSKTGRRMIPDFPMRAYRLDTVNHPSNIAGSMRAASPDEPFLVEWVHRFLVDTFGDDDPNYEARVRRSIQRFTSGPYRMVLWEVDGQPVSMSATIGLSPSGMRIGQVYTPDEHRGHGYASALVAALSQSLLDEGLQFCTLNTDIENPTTNKIYQAIGYYPVCDQTMFEVDPVAGEESR